MARVGAALPAGMITVVTFVGASLAAAVLQYRGVYRMMGLLAPKTQVAAGAVAMLSGVLYRFE